MTDSFKTTISMSPKQKTIETVWYSVVKQLTAESVTTRIHLDQDTVTLLGDSGVAAIAQRCSIFRNAQVEVMNQASTSALTLRVSAPETLKPNDPHILTNPSLRSTEDALIMEKKSTKTPRPPNSFILYRQHHHASVVARHPGMHNNQISQLIGKMWKNEPQRVRDEWKNKADAIKHQHALNYPDYQYQPRKPSERKRRRSRRTSPNTVSSPSEIDSLPSTPQSLACEATATCALDVPSFDAARQGEALSFTFDPTYTDQMALFEEMLSNQTAITSSPFSTDLSGSPAALTTLPTSAPTAPVLDDASKDAFTKAQNDLRAFDDYVGASVANELETIYEEANNPVPSAYSYNDAELQRFMTFLEQMPTDMWGMDIINVPKS